MKSVTKVYSLNINKGIVSAQFLGNLVGKNIVQNKIGAKAIRNSDILIRYQITDDLHLMKSHFWSHSLLKLVN